MREGKGREGKAPPEVFIQSLLHPKLEIKQRQTADSKEGGTHLRHTCADSDRGSVTDGCWKKSSDNNMMAPQISRSLIQHPHVFDFILVDSCFTDKSLGKAGILYS